MTPPRSGASSWCSPTDRTAGPTSLKKKWVSPAEIIDRARAEDVMIYAVGMQSRNDQPRQIGLGPEGTEGGAERRTCPIRRSRRSRRKAAADTRRSATVEDLAGAFTRVADEIHSQYLLGYTPPKRDGKVHHIDVQVSKSGMKPRARKSYVAPSDK